MDSRRRSLFLHDTFLILIMAVLAACGLIYEYLLSHYAGRVLGAVETAIYSMIGLMIVSMGIGAFAARWIKDPFTGFVWLEVLIAFLGSTSIMVIAIIIAISQDMPRMLTEHLNLTEPLAVNGPFFIWMNELAQNSPYIMGFILGCMIGMEIPLIARIREKIHDAHLKNNAGTIYGADYIGAGGGAALWVTVMLSMHIAHAAVLTASLNLIAGSFFLYKYREQIRGKFVLWALHGLMIFVVAAIYMSGKDWLSDLNNVLYKDKVVYRTQTHYQNVTITQRKLGMNQSIFYDLYLNGRLQFSATDEKIYHSMLVYPAMAASARHERVLIIGGGDGLALRDALKWDPKHVTLIDLDQQLVNLFADGQFIDKEYTDDEKHFMSILSELNQKAFSDPRVNVMFGDAFIEVNKLLDQQVGFDTIIVDLPDPSHPDLNKLYSDLFYNRLSQLLYGDGVMVVQSTSPYHAKNAFICIGKTIKASGFQYVEQYHQNVPSFGQWGWSIATKKGASARTRLNRIEKLPVDDWYMTKGILTGAFEFPAYYWQGSEKIEVNQIGTNRAYQYHFQAWNQDEEALF